MNTKLEDIAKKVGRALDAAMAACNQVHTLQKDNLALNEKLLLLDVNSQGLNIKIRGFLEKGEENINLQSCIACWLAKEMNMKITFHQHSLRLIGSVP